MATVFLAQDLKHKRPVALKVLHPELGHALGPERFRREVELAARLQHPHILTVFDSGEAAGQLWFTMPFVEGEGLRDRLTRDRQLPVEDAVRIATEVARALDYAHQHGVVHRDIKPENILLTRDGYTLVADFGIARALQSGGDEGGLTETGMAVGTPAYMSPEQAAGERALDARTDVYSLGSVLYEMLAGEPPFTGPTVQAIIGKRLRGDVPDVRAARPAVSRMLGDVVRKALAPVPADRYATAGDFAKALSDTITASLTAARPSATSERPVVAAPRRRIPTGLALLVLGFLVGVGVLFAWRRGSHSAGVGGPKVIAVLPFENQGDTAQAYFADGITDEVRAKLSALPGLQVIASSSTDEYRSGGKPLTQVGDELGANYLLVAKVRWARGADGTQQVRVSPELVALAGGKSTLQWKQTFDATLTSVFEVQASIAGQVAEALDIALTDSASKHLAAQPTANLPAYEAYLRGEQAFADLTPTGQRRAQSYYRQALALDSTFAPAWAQLSRTLITLYNGFTPSRALAAEAQAAADRALALDPAVVEGHLARASFAQNVLRDDPQAEAAIRAGLAVAPNEPRLLSRLALALEARGQLDSALAFNERAVRLDPRAPLLRRELSRELRALRRLPESLREARQATALGRGNIRYSQNEALTLLAMGDLPGARATVTAAQRASEPSRVVSYYATYSDLFWVLGDADQQLLLTLTPTDFDDERGDWALALAETWWLRGDRARARAYADTAAVTYGAFVAQTPLPAIQVLHGMALAYAGRGAEAVRAADAALAGLTPGERVSNRGGYNRHVRARLFLVLGQPERAVDELEAMLKVFYDVTPAWLRIDPNFAALKGNPRFERLLASP